MWLRHLDERPPDRGNVYDRRLIAELIACGVDLHEHRADGIWPRVSAVERDELGDLLTREPRWLIDAIVACGAPEVVTAAVGTGRPIVVLVHSFMSDDVWSSTAELRAYEEAERDPACREPRDLYEPLVGGSGGVGFLPRASPPCHLNRSDEPADANQAVSDHLRHFTLGDLGIALTFGSIAGHGHGGEAT
jgi:hypothetical protein